MRIFGLDISRTKKRQSTVYNPYLDFSLPSDFSTADVNVNSVSGIAAWDRGSQILSNTLAGLPKHLVRYEGDDRKTITSAPSVSLITDMANYNLDSYSWHDYIMQSVINYGNGYSLIKRDENNRPISLETVHPDRVVVKVYDNAVVYQINTNDKKNFEVLYEDMYHIKGLSHNAYVGINPLKAHSVSLGATISAQNYGKNSFDKGFLSSGYLKLEGRLSQEAKDNISKNWQNKVLGTNNMQTPILDVGQEYVPLKMSMQDAQYIENRRFQKSEIATILGIPSHFINEMGDAKYNNVENTNTQFVQYTIMSYVHKFEIENKKLLTTAQRKTHKWKYNVNGLMRGDMATRSEYYAKMIQNSVLKPSEVRSLEDWTGGIDDYLISTNNQVPYSKLDEVLNKNNNEGI